MGKIYGNMGLYLSSLFHFACLPRSPSSLCVPSLLRRIDVAGYLNTHLMQSLRTQRILYANNYHIPSILDLRLQFI